MLQYREMNLKFGRIITAMVTPFTTEGRVNYDESIRLAKHLVDTGTDTVLLAGTTGESPTLTHDEEFELFRVVKNALGSDIMVMAGTGSNCTRTAIQATQEAEKLGLDASLQVVPYYNKPSQEGIFQHFKAISESTALPLLLYNIPGRTGTNMLPETVGRLSLLPNIIGVKEASGSIEQVKKIRHLTDPSFLIYSGDDGLTLDFMKEGACGVVSVASHLVGLDIRRMIKQLLNGDLKEAERENERLEELFKVLFITSNPSPVKAALTCLGFLVGNPRLPLVPVTDKEFETIKNVLLKMKLV